MPIIACTRWAMGFSTGFAPQPYPRREFGTEDESQTLVSLGLSPSASLLARTHVPGGGGTTRRCIWGLLRLAEKRGAYAMRAKR
jgi:hypothetical protein